MSRGGLLLRAARTGEELTYRPIAGAIRRGKRPPKLPRTRGEAAMGRDAAAGCEFGHDCCAIVSWRRPATDIFASHEAARILGAHGLVRGGRDPGRGSGLR
jgi:hypothetical protein